MSPKSYIRIYRITLVTIFEFRVFKVVENMGIDLKPLIRLNQLLSGVHISSDFL